MTTTMDNTACGDLAPTSEICRKDGGHCGVGGYCADCPAGISTLSTRLSAGQWFDARTLDEMQAFYLSRLPAIREAAKEHGYAIGLHGSLRRDFDLMAMQWRDSPSDKDTLAHAIAVAACGITRDGPFQWEQKPSGRFAVSMPVCWTDHRNPEFGEKPSLGHIDLSVITQQAAPAAIYQVWDTLEGGWSDTDKDAFNAAGEDDRRIVCEYPSASPVAAPAAPAGTICPDAAHMGEHACTDRAQCWEPCGDLGKSKHHAAQAATTASASEIDERYEFERYMSQQGEAVNYIGDGMYSSSFVDNRWDTWMARANLAVSQPPAGKEDA